MKYRVEFEFLNDFEEWISDDVSFYGTMTEKEAEYLCKDFKQRDKIRNVRIKKY